MLISITDQELSTILAALRLRQCQMASCKITRDTASDIADDGGQTIPLSSDEIDTLFERIRCPHAPIKIAAWDEVEHLGYAQFNRFPHICIDVPQSGPGNGLTISTKTQDGQKITFSFVGGADCVDIKLHSGIKFDPANAESPDTMNMRVFTYGGVIYSTKQSGRYATLVSILLDEKKEDDK